jgi:hypothetical protein
MLFNPKWKTDTKIDTKIDPLSLEALVAWLETKDPKEEYDFTHAAICLFGQWAKYCDADATMSPWGGSFIYMVHGNAVDFIHWKHIALSLHSSRYCFGEALKAAKAALKQEKENA